MTPKKAFLRAAKYHEIDDPEGLWGPVPQQSQQQGPPADPAKMAEVAMKAQKLQQDGKHAQAKAVMDAEKTKAELTDAQQERASRERIEMMKVTQERLRLASTLAIHASDQEATQRTMHRQMAAQELNDIRDYYRSEAEARRDMMLSERDRQHEIGMTVAEKQHEAEERERDREHERELERTRAAAKPKPKGGKS